MRWSDELRLWHHASSATTRRTDAAIVNPIIHVMSLLSPESAALVVDPAFDPLPTVGGLVGAGEGERVGCTVGIRVGGFVGDHVGANDVGSAVGATVAAVGDDDGEGVGRIDGAKDGGNVGEQDADPNLQ